MATSDYFEVDLSSMSDMEEDVGKQTALLVEEVNKMADEGASFGALLAVQERLAYLWVLYGTKAGQRIGMEGPTTRCDAHAQKAEEWRKEFDEPVATGPDGCSALDLGAGLAGKAWALGHIAYHEAWADTVRARALTETEEAKE